jgi:glycerophosphoryl diester phosphodiesterase
MCQPHQGVSSGLPLNADLAGACLIYLDTRSLLQWGAVSKACNRLFASEAQKRTHLQRLLLELHHAQDSLKAFSHMSGTETKPVAFGMASEPAPSCLNIGHKGAEGHIHGNTMASFHQAVKLGVDVIEFDVVACADGVLCHHDALFEETGEWFEDMTVAEVRRRIGKPHPTLTEMLSDKVLRDSGVHLYFDMKHTNIVRPTMRAIVRAVQEGGWCAAHLIVATFKQIELLEVNAYRHAIPELRALRTAVILDAIPISLGKEFAALGCAAVSVGQYCAVS